MHQYLLITDIKRDGTAMEAGLRSGDCLVAYQTIRIRSNDDLGQAIAKHLDDQHVVLTIFRDNNLMSFSAKPGRLGMSTTEAKDAVIAKILDEQLASFHVYAAAKNVSLSTTSSIAGYSVVQSIDIVSAECAFGMNLFKDFFAGARDFFGGRSQATQDVLRDARQTCLDELRAEAHRIGANAVIGVDLDYSEFSGQGKSMVFLVASGTAVIIEENA